jgi:MFS family permease
MIESQTSRCAAGAIASLRCATGQPTPHGSSWPVTAGSRARPSSARGISSASSPTPRGPKRPETRTGRVDLLTLGFVLGMLGPGLMFGPQASFLAELFPTRVRSSGASIGFQLGGVLAGALSPVIAAGLVGAGGDLRPAGLYMLALGLMSIASVALAPGPTAREATESRSFSAAAVP